MNFKSCIAINILSFTFNFSKVDALELQSQCMMSLEDSVIKGQNLDDIYPIASLSKIFTTYWAIKKWGAEHQFKTQVYIKKEESSGQIKVHVKGGRDPYFSNDRMQAIVKRLNESGITQISELTFDENFIYMQNMEDFAPSDAKDFSWRMKQVKNDLQSFFQNPNYNYARTKLRVQKKSGEVWPEQIQMSVLQINQVSSQQFDVNNFDYQITVKSTELKNLLYNMNKYSNNHVADFTYQVLGGNKQFQKFLIDELNIGEKDFDFINGSGGPKIITPAQGQNPEIKAYNQTTCRTVLNVLADLNHVLLTTSDQTRLWHLFSTAGVEADPQNVSPVTKYYKSDFTTGAVTGKTGTVNQTIGFAGLASTDQGQVLFTIIYKTTDKSEWIPARTLISQIVNNFMKEQGSQKLPSKDELFLSFNPEEIKD